MQGRFGAMAAVCVVVAVGCGGGARRARAPQAAAAEPAVAPVVAPVVAVAVVQPEPQAEPAPAPAHGPKPEAEPEALPEPAIPPGSGFAPTSADVILLQQVLVAMEEVARIMESTRDCDRMVDGLEIAATRFRPLFETAKQMDKGGPRAAWFKQQGEAPMLAMVQRMMEPLQRCAQNKRLLALMQRLGS
jgi:hypothetical protein